MRLTALLLVLLAANAGAQERPGGTAVVVRGARIHLGTGGILDGGSIVIENGRIKAVGKTVEIPAGAEILEAGGLVVIPGLVDACTSLFVGEGTEGGSAEHDVFDAIDGFDKTWREVLESGVTTVYVNPPNRGPVHGLGAVLRLNGSSDPAKLTLRRGAAVKLSIGQTTSPASAPVQRYQEAKSLRSLLEGAKQYVETWEKYRKDLEEYEKKHKEWEEQKKAGSAPKSEPPKGGTPAPPKPEGPKPNPPDQDPPKPAPPAKPPEEPKKPAEPRSDPRFEALQAAIDAKSPLPVRIEARTPDAVEHALKLAEDFKLRLVLEGVTDVGPHAAAIAKAKIPVVAGPLFRYGVREVEFLGHDPATPGRLVQSKIAVAFGSFPTRRAGLRGAGASRFLLEGAGLAAGAGMPRDAALKAITLEAARACGVDKDAGSIEPGKLGDLVFLSGEPFAEGTRVVRVVLEGRTVFERGGGR